jgi:hypothetical protein
MSLCSENPEIAGNDEVNETLIIDVNKFGRILSVTSVRKGFKENAEIEKMIGEYSQEVDYDDDELWFVKTLEGSYFYRTDKCCWRKVRGKWRCRSGYCTD